MNWRIEKTEAGWALYRDDEQISVHKERAGAMSALEDAMAAADEKPSRGSPFVIEFMEDDRSVDNRVVDENATKFDRKPPLPLMMTTEKTIGHEGAKLAGVIESLGRDGKRVFGNGYFDAGSEAGQEAERLVDEGILSTWSPDFGNVEAEIEVLAEDGDGDPEDILLHLRSGTLLGGTIVPFPALGSAKISIDKKAVAASAEVSELAWDGDSARFDDAQWKRACAVCENGGKTPKSDCHLPHHDPGGALNEDGLAAAAGRWGQYQGAGKGTAKSHIIGHYHTLGKPVPPSLGGDEKSAESVIAAAIPVEPPKEWFADPGLEEPTPLTVTDEGRIYGHFAAWGTCHIAHDSMCLTPPRSGAEYAYFRTGALHTREGLVVSVGTITLDTGHAALSLGHRAAASHYDNTGVAVADVAVGEDEFGPWVAGALRPGVTPEQIRTLRASALSGDWRKISGSLELVALLAVNVPGFPVTRAGMVADGQVALVAAGGKQLLKATDPQERRIAALERRVEKLGMLVKPLRGLAREAIVAAVSTELRQQNRTTR